MAAWSGLVGCGACPGTGYDPEVPRPPELEGATPMLGDVTCAADAEDCNVCAPGVESQFSSAEWRGGVRTWSFEPDAGDFDVRPRRAYDGFWFGGHAQGFVRLNGPGEAYALVHSKGRGNIASLSFVSEGEAGLALTALYRLDAPGAHTSGAFVLGRYVGLLERPRGLTLFDARAAVERRRAAVKRLELSDDPGAPFMQSPKHHGLSDWSGGVAMAKLASGRYLLLANEGGDSSGNSHLFEVASLGTGASSVVPMRELGESAYTPSPVICAEHHRSENAALVTECRTGRLYAVHVGSNDDIKGKNSDELGLYHTFWRLSRVMLSQGGPFLEPVGVYLRRAQQSYCHGRSAGSVFVEPASGRVTLLCHERDQSDPRAGPWYFWSQTNGPAR